MLFTITDLHYAIGDKVILDGINMTMEDKDKIALVGLNGAGKSTLLKLIAKGDNPAISYRKDLQISYLPQYSDFDEALTVYAQATKMAPKAQDYEIKATLTRFGLDDPDQKISVLSGGQKKRSSCTRTGAGKFLPQRLVATMKIPEKISVIMMTIFALRSSRKAELLIPKKSPIRMNGYVMAACFRLAALMIPVAM